MSRGKKFFLGLALSGLGIALLGSPVSAQLVISEPAAGIDNLPPAPITSLAVQPGLTTSVSLSWVLSVDDFDRQAATGTDFTSGGGFNTKNDVAGYKVWRQIDDANPELLTELPAGTDSYVDEAVSMGRLYTYLVAAFDAAGNQSLPAQESLRLGWAGDFDGDGIVNFDDFLAFAAHFGLISENPDWNPIFDLNADGRVDFDDFLIFAANFGQGQ